MKNSSSEVLNATSLNRKRLREAEDFPKLLKSSLVGGYLVMVIFPLVKPYSIVLSVAADLSGRFFFPPLGSSRCVFSAWEMYKANAAKLLVRVLSVGGLGLPSALPAGIAVERGDSCFCFVIPLALPRKII